MDTHPSMLSEEDFFEHAGIKGMKWGRRKNTSKPTHTSADAARVNKITNRAKTKGTDNLSNDDIAKLNKRSQLLSEYKKNNPSTLRKGYNITKEAVAVAGTLTAAVAIGTKLAKSPLAQKGAQLVAEALKSL